MSQEAVKNPDQVHILNAIKDTDLTLKILLMKRKFTISQLIALGPGSVLMFEAPAATPASLLVNGKSIATGDVMQVGERFGMKIGKML